MTRLPLLRVSARFSAGCRHSVQRRNMASPSFHSPLARSKIRGVDATVKSATATPDWVKRSSGSAVRFPTRVMAVSPDMMCSFGFRDSVSLGDDVMGADLMAPVVSRSRRFIGERADGISRGIDLGGRRGARTVSYTHLR